MKLKWPLWVIVTVWLLLHLIAFLSFPYGSPIELIHLGFIPGALIYLVWGAFAPSIGYGVVVGKETLAAWKKQSKDESPAAEINADSPKKLAWGYVAWLLCPVIIYIPFFLIALSEK